MASANGTVGRSSLGKGRMVQQTIVLPRICSNSSSRAARDSLAAEQTAAEEAAVWQPISAATIRSSGAARKRGSLQQQQ